MGFLNVHSRGQVASHKLKRASTHIYIYIYIYIYYCRCISKLFSLIFFLLLAKFLTPVLADGFHVDLGGSKSPQVFCTLLNILANLYSAVIWMFSVRPPISKLLSPFSKP